MDSCLEIIHDMPSYDPSWRDWERLVHKEEWFEDDHCVTACIPKCDSTRSVVAKTKDGRLVGCMVWNDFNKSLCYLSSIVLAHEFRAKGIGISIWRVAKKRFPNDKVLAMRGVPEMVEKYKKEFAPTIQGCTAVDFIGNHKDLTMAIRQELAKLPPQHLPTLPVRDLSPEELSRYFDFDHFVSGNNRSQYLRQYLTLPFYNNFVLIENRRIVASASVTPTSDPELHLYKIAPIYAENLQKALYLILQISEEVIRKDPNARFNIPIHTGSAGERTLAPILKQCMKEKISGITLFNKEYRNPIRIGHVFAPNNNCMHTDL